MIAAHARGVAIQLAAPSLHPPFRQIQELSYQLSAIRRLEIWPGGYVVAVAGQWAPSGIQKIQDMHNKLGSPFRQADRHLDMQR